jgi:hypothetical protein
LFLDCGWSQSTVEAMFFYYSNFSACAPAIFFSLLFF